MNISAVEIKANLLPLLFPINDCDHQRISFNADGVLAPRDCVFSDGRRRFQRSGPFAVYEAEFVGRRLCRRWGDADAQCVAGERGQRKIH